VTSQRAPLHTMEYAKSTEMGQATLPVMDPTQGCAMSRPPREASHYSTALRSVKYERGYDSTENFFCIHSFID